MHQWKVKSVRRSEPDKGHMELMFSKRGPHGRGPCLGCMSQYQARVWCLARVTWATQSSLRLRGKRLRLTRGERLRLRPSPERGCSQWPESGSESHSAQIRYLGPGAWTSEINHNQTIKWNRVLHCKETKTLNVSYLKVIWVLVSKLKIELR